MLCVAPKIHKRRREYLTAKMPFSKYKGNQTYFCVVAVIIPCPVVVLNIIMQVHFLLQKEHLQAGMLELDSLSLIHFW